MDAPRSLVPTWLRLPRAWLVLRILLHPVRSVQERIDAWVLSRVRREPPPVRIHRRRLYIVPTRYGYVFAGLLVVMLLAAMNYSNSMAFGLTFLLAGIGLVAMHRTHANLVDLTVRAGRIRPVFAGQTLRVPIRIDNPGRLPRYAIAVAWPRGADEDVTDLPSAGAGAELVLHLPAPRRGRLPVGVFSIHTEFPLGLFHAWTWVELDVTALVYPCPAPPGVPPPVASGLSGDRGGPRDGQDEFAGLRGWRRGDPVRSVHWKSLPKLRRPMVKQFTEVLDRELWLDFQAADGDTERRLSRLCRWVLEADAAGTSYGLRLPGLTIAPGRGAAHRHRCLRALALFDAPAPNRQAA